MAFDFPSSPTNGQTYTLGGITYVYNGYAWAPQSGGGPFAPIASPVFTGNPQAPTPAPDDNDTSLATTAYVQEATDYTQGGTGAQTMKIEARVRENVHVREFGAVPYAGDQTTKLRNALIFAMNNGMALELGAGAYEVSSTGGYALEISQPVRIFGQGYWRSSLNPVGVVAGQSVIRLNADIAGGLVGAVLEDFGIDDRPADVHGITFWPGSAAIGHVNVQRLRIGNGNGWGVYSAPPSTPGNVGLYLSTFRDVHIGGNGMHFEQLGDGNLFDKCAFHPGYGSPVKYYGTGIWIDCVSGAGGNKIVNCNFQVSNGAIVVHYARNMQIENCNIEYIAPDYGSEVPVIQILGDTGRCVNPHILNTHIGMIATNLQPPTLIYLEACDGAVIDGCSLHDLTDTGVVRHGIVIGLTANDTTIGKIAFSPGDFPDGLVGDNGKGTRGTIRPIYVLGDPIFGNGAPAYTKDADGIVRLLSGIITATANPYGKVVVNLPAEYRPSFSTWLVGFGKNAAGDAYEGVPFFANINGEVVYFGGTVSDQLTLNGLSWPTSTQIVSPYAIPPPPPPEAHSREPTPPPDVIPVVIEQPPDIPPLSGPPWQPPDVPPPEALA